MHIRVLSIHKSHKKRTFIQYPMNEGALQSGVFLSYRLNLIYYSLLYMIDFFIDTILPFALDDL